MSKTRLFIPEAPEIGRTVTLDDERAHYLGRVLRMRPGDPLTVFDGSGGEFRAEVAALRRDEASLDILERVVLDTESPLRVRLVQGISRGERMDYTVQKATELGVACVLPVQTARSVVRLGGARKEKRLEHWRRIAVGAAEQSGRTRVPMLEVPVNLDEYLGTPGADRPRYLLQPGTPDRLADIATPGDAGIDLLVGPEGGFETDEERAALAAGCVPVSLGPRVLRSETAGVAALAVLQALFGDL